MGANSMSGAGPATPLGAAVPTLPPPRLATSTPPPISGVHATTNWGSLYQEHADFVWRSLQRMGVKGDDARDALQDVFLVVHRRLPTFDPELGTPRSWLFGIAANVARANTRRRRPIPVECPETLAADSEPRGGDLSNVGGPDAVGTRVLRENIQSAVASLDPERRAVFVMFELEGLECLAIADELGVPLGTVYSRLHHARKQLREALAAHRPEGKGKSL